MSHVTHQREAFTDYTPMGNSSITGVGRKEALIMGHGTVELKSTCNGANDGLLCSPRGKYTKTTQSMGS